MLYKTRGVALSYIKYKESSIIAKIFTEVFGMQSYIVNSVRTKNAKTKIALFQPLTILDLVVYHNKKKDINRISEIKCSHNFHTIPFDIRKTAIALFLTELLNCTLHEEEENENIFDFVHESITTFDAILQNFENFHIQFLMQLSRYLGIVPDSGKNMLLEVGHAKVYDKIFVDRIDFLLSSNFYQHIKLSKSDRNEILKALIEFYRFHFDSIREIKSLQVLREVLS